MKLSRIFLILTIAILAIMSLTVAANAYTSAELADYITGVQLVGTNQYKLNDASSAQVKAYLAAHPVTDATAAQIKSLLDQAKGIANGKTDISQFSQAEKSQILSLFQQAGNLAGVTVSVNTATNTITVTDGQTVLINGQFVGDGNGGLTIKFGPVGGSSASTGSAAAAKTSSAKKFVYTGANSTVFAVIALVAVVAVSTVLVKKVYAK